MRMKSKSLIGAAVQTALCALIITLILQSDPLFAQSEQKIAVLVNDHPITAYDINQRVQLLLLNDRSIGKR